MLSVIYYNSLHQLHYKAPQTQTKEVNKNKNTKID